LLRKFGFWMFSLQWERWEGKQWKMKMKMKIYFIETSDETELMCFCHGYWLLIIFVIFYCPPKIRNGFFLHVWNVHARVFVDVTRSCGLARVPMASLFCPLWGVRFTGHNNDSAWFLNFKITQNRFLISLCNFPLFIF